ncbi:DUF6119 family protein [Ruminococcus sp.]|uniref:DUF6119 family protein n=1 Tax=Ruminococcus sp. TaxID=41978 RepID=UPI002E80ED5C|nr:DUF6119 family protein [Ruminococcus sp.]MEE3492041.1 DUF6119 family protein [Ruminococcus sp.]
MSDTGSNKKIHSIYLIDHEKVKNKYYEGESPDFEDIIVAINNHYSKPYKPQTIKENFNLNGFDIAMYCRIDNASRKLANFCSVFLEPKSELLTASPIIVSSVLFIWSEKNIFAITTGQGYHMIEEFCVNRFGIIGLSLFDQFRITAVDSNSMSGMIHSNKTIYTREIDFVDVESLDTIYKGITGRMNDKNRVHQLLSLKPESKKSSVKITAKNSIQFSGSLDFKGLINLLSILDNNDYSELKDIYNSISPIDKKKNVQLLETIQKAVINKVYAAINTSSPFPFDLFNRSTYAFVGAEEYSISINGKLFGNTTEDIDASDFISAAYTDYLKDDESSYESFEKFFNRARIIAIKGDIPTTNGSILEHLSGEIEVDRKNYYVFYGEFYYLDSSYSERLNKTLSAKLQHDRYIDLISSSWDKGFNENDFNEKASLNEGFTHLHKIMPEYIEFADLFKKDGNDIYIVHVKDGFDNDMRALDRQIELSISRLHDLKNNNNDSYFREVYDNAKDKDKGRNITSDFPTVESFLSALKECTPYYVAAIHPPKKDLMENTSNIAKHCLNSLILRCNNQGVSLRINIIS